MKSKKPRKSETLVIKNTDMVINIDDHNYVVNQEAHNLFIKAIQLMEQKDSKGAVAAYEKSALLNHPFALTTMGTYYLEGELVPMDFCEAARCFKKAAEQQLPNAKYSFGLCLYRGLGIEQNKLQAMKLFLSVPKEDCSPDILVIIAESYEEGTHGLTQSYAKALVHFELAASKGNEYASKRAMKLYLNGKGCKKDFEKAMTFSEPLNKFADDPELLNYIGSLYNSKSNFNKALECYKLACDAGNEIAAYNLATLYYENKALKNLPEAVKYFKLSADKGYSPAQYFWGFLLLEGNSVEQNFSEAIKYLTLAAQKISDADYYLGECHTLGRGVKIDMAKGFEYFKKAEEKQPKAQLALGYYYLDGEVVEKDIDLAFKYFAKAAQHPVAAAKQAYGLCLLHGIGCKPDLKKAKNHLEKAETLAKNESLIEPAIIKGYLSLNAQELKLCADIYFERKRYPFAFGHYERALQKTENKKDLLLEIAALQLQIKDYDAALKSYEKLLEISPDNSQAIRQKLVCLGLTNEDANACLLLEKYSKILVSFVKESEEPWAERIYKLYLDHQNKKNEKIAEKIQIKRAKLLAKKERKKPADIQEKSTEITPEIVEPPLLEIETTLPEKAVETVLQIAEVREAEAAVPEMIVKIPQIDILEPQHAQVQEDEAVMPEEKVVLVPQIAVSDPQPSEAENQAIIPAILIYPKVKFPKEILEAFHDIQQRIGAQHLELYGLTALHLILSTIYDEKINLKEPRNWNFFTTDPVEKLSLIHGQFPPISPKLYVDNGQIPYEKPIYLYCEQNKNNIGIFSIHQLSIDSEGNINGPELAFQDLKAMILRCIRPQAQIEKTTLNTFLAKFSGTPFSLLKEQSYASPVQLGIFAQTIFRSEVAFSEKIRMTSDKNKLTLSFHASNDSKTGIASVRKELGEVAQKATNNSDLDYNSKCKTTFDGSLFHVKLIFEFESLADLETMQKLVNEIRLSRLDQTNRSELR